MTLNSQSTWSSLLGELQRISKQTKPPLDLIVVCVVYTHVLSCTLFLLRSLAPRSRIGTILARRPIRGLNLVALNGPMVGSICQRMLLLAKQASRVSYTEKPRGRTTVVPSNGQTTAVKYKHERPCHSLVGDARADICKACLHSTGPVVPSKGLPQADLSRLKN